MKTCFLLTALIVPGFVVQAQDRTIPMMPTHWEADTARVAFTTHRGVLAARGRDGGAQLFLKDVSFSSGTIEFDVEIEDPGFVGINFRQSESRSESEFFYIRAFWPVSPFSRNTLQYATIVQGVNLWDVTDDYQAAALLKREGWNRVKLVISGRQMRVYINDMEHVALHVPILEGMIETGGISLEGNAVFTNFVVRPNVTEDLPSVAGYDPTMNDSRYLRNWHVTSPVDFPFSRDLVLDLPSMFGSDLESDLPDENTIWTSIRAEHRALVNLSRPFGLTQKEQRRLVWVKTTLVSETEQQRRLDLGFSDEIWVFINGQFLRRDTNYYGTPGAKEPDGWATLDNASMMLPLAEGENELMIGVANYFFGWGLIARMDTMEGIVPE
ncbi:MAG: hypothetical protein RhofKO_22130 [Rhodothermales bacterium]